MERVNGVLRANFESKPLSYHKCTKNDTYVDFVEHQRNAIGFVKSMNCLEQDDDIVISGHTKTQSFKNLWIKLRRCQGENCASEKEIDEYL